MVSAVLTADIVNSTALLKSVERKLIGVFEKILRPHLYEFYRGDSFQAFIKNADQALLIALLLRTAAKRIEQDSNNLFDVRIGMALGTVKGTVKTLSLARAEPFVLSGRTFDQLSKSGKRLQIISGDDTLNIALELLSEYVDELLQQMTSKQAAVIFELLRGARQNEVARKFRKAPATINKQVQAARWEQLQSVLNKFDRIIKALSV